VSFGDYFKGGLGTHLTGILAELFGDGNSFNIIAAGRADSRFPYGLGTGRDDGGGVLGRLYLERIPRRAEGNEQLYRGDVCLLFDRVR